VSIDRDTLGMPVLRESDADLVVVKPAGMATELTSDPRRASLISRVRLAAGQGVTPRLVHRLDRVTRGVMIVTLTKQAAAFYGEQIREGMWDKYYLARIPRPDPKRNPLHEGLVGKHKAHIKEEDKRARIVRSGGKVSLLEILAIEEAPGFPGQSHALIRLLTGRLHQIRVMLAGLGLPLVGDRFYGGAEGEMYLEHIALWYVDFTTRDMKLAHLAEDPEREAISARLRDRLGLVVRGGSRQV
jgi:23S rRNA-/tRNA-specific pseudouridylate synthase